MSLLGAFGRTWRFDAADEEHDVPPLDEAALEPVRYLPERPLPFLWFFVRSHYLARYAVMVVLVVATAVAVVRGAVDQIKEITAEDPFLFLRLFTRGGPLPLVALLSFLIPLIAIGLGFDAVNG